MLAPLFFTAFAGSNSKVVRLALLLMRDYDLVNFRILRMPNLGRDYGKNFSVAAFDTLVTMGFLERGPAAKFVGIGSGFATFRIHPSFLMRPSDLQVYFRNQKDTLERLDLAPGQMVRRMIAEEEKKRQKTLVTK